MLLSHHKLLHEEQVVCFLMNSKFNHILYNAFVIFNFLLKMHTFTAHMVSFMYNIIEWYYSLPFYRIVFVIHRNFLMIFYRIYDGAQQKNIKFVVCQWWDLCMHVDVVLRWKLSTATWFSISMLTSTGMRSNTTSFFHSWKCVDKTNLI